MSLKTRLASLQAQTGGGCDSPVPASADLRQRLARIRTQRLSSQSTVTCAPISEAELARRLNGRQIAEGVIHLHRRVPLTGSLSKVPLACLREPARLPGEDQSDGLRQVYIDTETTGLSGGSGTLAFLVGMAVVEDEAVVLSQLLLTRFSGEAALLSAFSMALSPLDRLVSYNGKSYDLPLLMTRFRMQALSPPFAALSHLDLLHPTRRLFARRWPDCRLLTLEERLLGFRRVNDLPGAEAPAAWFDYLRHGRGDKLIQVVKHNRQDILSLVAAHSAVAQAIKQPEAFDVDLVGLARWLAETDEPRARELLLSDADRLCNAGKRLLGHLARRAGDWPLAVGLWEGLAASGCTHSIERLAKYHEHVSKDLAMAKHYCEQLPRNAVQGQRLKRLNEKLCNQAIQQQTIKAQHT